MFQSVRVDDVSHRSGGNQGAESKARQEPGLGFISSRVFSGL